MINKVLIIGNLGADPEIKYTQGGKAVATISVATTRRWKDREGNKQEETEWHRVVAWEHSANYAKDYLNKGDKVYIEGRLQTRKWQDQNNNDRYTTEIICNDLQGLGGRTNTDDHGSEPF